MDVYKECMKLLSDADLFESADHQSRFSELVSCYYKYPFFSDGMCKCMFLSSWDMEHFIIMLDILNALTIEHSQNLEMMKDNGKVLEAQVEGYEKYVMQLSQSFLNDTVFEMPQEPMEAEGLHIIRQALKAADLIDQAFENCL